MQPDELARRFWHGPDIELANVGAISAEDYYTRSSVRLDLPTDLVRAMVSELFVGEFNHEFAGFVRQLRAAGVPISALTNNWSGESELMARQELRGLFDRVISSADVGTTKPGEAIYRIALERLGRGRGDVLFVDDNVQNVETARSLGWTSIHFVRTTHAIGAIGRVYGVKPNA